MAPTLRVAGRSFRYRGSRYRRGDTFEGDADLLEKHPNTLAQVEDEVEQSGETEEVEEVADTDDGVTAAEIDPHPSDLNVPELKERLGDVDDVETVEAILELEKEREGRTTAVTAIESRLSELEE